MDKIEAEKKQLVDERTKLVADFGSSAVSLDLTKKELADAKADREKTGRTEKSDREKELEKAIERLQPLADAYQRRLADLDARIKELDRRAAVQLRKMRDCDENIQTINDNANNGREPQIAPEHVFDPTLIGLRPIGEVMAEEAKQTAPPNPPNPPATPVPAVPK